MRRDIDRRHYTAREPKEGEKLPHIAGFNLLLTAEHRKLPRAMRRVLAGVRRPLRTWELAQVLIREATEVVAASRSTKGGA